MHVLTARKLASFVHGRLELAGMPPLDGSLSVVGRIRTDVGRIVEGEVFWAVDGMTNSGRERIEEAFARGAAGVVASGYRGEPWAGRWAVHVEDAGQAFFRAAASASALGVELGEAESEEKVVRTARRKCHPLCREVRTDWVTVLDWSQDATVDRWSSALEELRGFPTHHRRWVALGDLCGPRWDTGAMHRKLGLDTVSMGAADGVVACGQFARDVALGARDAGLSISQAVACRTVTEAIVGAERLLTPGDILLVAGSRHLNMMLLVAAIEKRRAAA